MTLYILENEFFNVEEEHYLSCHRYVVAIQAFATKMFEFLVAQVGPNTRTVRTFHQDFLNLLIIEQLKICHYFTDNYNVAWFFFDTEICRIFVIRICLNNFKRIDDCLMRFFAGKSFCKQC